MKSLMILMILMILFVGLAVSVDPPKKFTAVCDLQAAEAFFVFKKSAIITLTQIVIF